MADWGPIEWAAVVQAISMVVLAVITFFYMRSTSMMANETREQGARDGENAKTARRPHIVVRTGALTGPELEPDETEIYFEYPREVVITVLNCGDRVAVNVSASVLGQAKIESDDPLTRLFSVSHFIDKRPDSLMMPGDQGEFGLFVERPPVDEESRDIPRWIIDEVGYPSELFLAVWYRGGAGDRYVTLVDLEVNHDVRWMLEECRHLFLNVPDDWEFPGE